MCVWIVCFTAAFVAVLVADLAGAAAFLAGAAAFLTGAFFATAFLAGAFLAGAFFSVDMCLFLVVIRSTYEYGRMLSRTTLP